MLKLDSIKVAYGAIQAVKGVSLEVRQGEVVTIIGANGAGKSTLLKSICGLEPVAEGRIQVDGKDITTAKAHERVALGVADRAYVLETGCITLEGTGSALLNDPKVKAAYLGAH